MRIIAGTLKGQTLKTSEGPGYRPATARVREAAFSIFEAKGMQWEGCRVLDLFAGSGSLAFEALSRGAETIWLVEKARNILKCLRQNAAKFCPDSGRCRVIAADVRDFLRTPAETPFDLIFADPPYGQNLLAPVLAAIERGNWLAPNGFMLAETEASLHHSAGSGIFLCPELDRTYGQTRILVWHLPPNA